MYLGGNFVTPIHELSLELNNNNYYIKRDDLLPVSFGGNKARKAILFFKDLENENADCVVTYGSSSSNHCRIIANIATAKNLPCYIISPNEENHPTSNSKMINLFNAKVIRCPINEVSMTIETHLLNLRRKGYKPYFIQGGGHGDIGTQAYINVYKEILDFEDSLGRFFDYIFHTSGTGTTQAGLICGNLLNGDKRSIVGISIARKMEYGTQVVLESVNSYLKSHKESIVNSEVVCFTDEYILDGYGSYNQEILKTINDVLTKDGIPMDTTYTGKAFWGMKEYIKKNNIDRKNILFIHTGGTPLFFDALGEMKSE